MTVTLRFVAALRDRMGEAERHITLPDTITDSDGLVAHLREQDSAAEALAHPSVRLILNDLITPRPCPLKDGDTLAFCPPFTGG